MIADKFLKVLVEILIEITELSHDPEKDMAEELLTNQLNLDRLISNEVARLRREERR